MTTEEKGGSHEHCPCITSGRHAQRALSIPGCGCACHTDPEENR